MVAGIKLKECHFNFVQKWGGFRLENCSSSDLEDLQSQIRDHHVTSYSDVSTFGTPGINIRSIHYCISNVFSVKS